MKYRIFNVLPAFGTNTYLVWDEFSKEAMIIDPADKSQTLLDAVKGLNLKYIVNTHGHGDHIGGNKFLKENTQAKLAIHELDASMLNDPNQNLSTHWGAQLVSASADIKLKDGDSLQLGNKKIAVIHTPGHSRGGICLLVEDLLFCGDTLFAGSIGRTDLPGGDYATLINAIKTKLLILNGNTKVFPGHGPDTTIEDEKIGNPFVGMMVR
ncbi:MAG: MBL fold metallo-hydrolase [Candidatus Cloacimonadota bacterium]|nr:MAG: MBL fold metallo-hydrolase [Candidatus Cloacimonadota bacterium]